MWTKAIAFVGVIVVAQDLASATLALTDPRRPR